MISAATKKGIKELINAAAEELGKLPPTTVYESEYVPRKKMLGDPEDLIIERHGDVWTIEGAWMERLVQGVNFSDYESRMYFDRMLRNADIFSRLEVLGINEGDTVSIYDLEFEYVR